MPSLVQLVTGFIIGAMAVWGILELNKKRKGIGFLFLFATMMIAIPLIKTFLMKIS
ncbi:hypothetical protein ACFFGV_15220 [Pontibacillus salicampi]|uniref:DUF3953 domain-containing protein n=1 Tax=Pontibacillus salicampi TaxID=1449801 RepID=A0ABV6LRQ9_9BACI